MKLLNIITTILSVIAAVYFFRTLPPPASFALAGLFGIVALYAFTRSTQAKSRPIIRLKGLAWTREDFCRGWLITGDTGSGKTRSGITPLL